MSAQQSRAEYQDAPSPGAADPLIDVLSERVSELVAAAYRMGKEGVAFDEPDSLRQHLGAPTSALIAAVQTLLDRHDDAAATGRRHLVSRLQWQERALADAERDVQHLRSELASVATLVGADDPSRAGREDAARLAELQALGVAPAAPVEARDGD
jgi:hypothetical protein